MVLAVTEHNISDDLSKMITHDLYECLDSLLEIMSIAEETNMNELDKKIDELYAIKDVIEILSRAEQQFMSFNVGSNEWEAPSCDPADISTIYDYYRFVILNDLINGLYTKAGIKPNKR